MVAHSSGRVILARVAIARIHGGRVRWIANSIVLISRI